MPTWSRQLPPAGKNHGFQLKRTPVTGSLKGIVTSSDILVCDTHFWHGRTTPCERLTNDEGKTIDDSMCPACVAKQPYRTHVYVSAYSSLSKEHFLFECTANAAKAFVDYRDTAGTLRGAAFSASRNKPAPNAKVMIGCFTANLGQVSLPAEPDVARALAVIWRLPASAMPVVEPKWEPPTVRPDPLPLKEMRTQPANAADVLPIGELLSNAVKGARKGKACAT